MVGGIFLNAVGKRLKELVGIHSVICKCTLQSVRTKQTKA